MALITKELLAEIGVNASEEDIAKLSIHFETTLDKRVMDSVIAELEDQQITELQKLKEGSDEQLVAWLNQNVPELKDIIEEETDILLGELAEHSEEL